MGYISAKKMGGNQLGGSLFDENHHSIRGLEYVFDEKLARRQIGEKKDLNKAMNAEEARQKQEGSFPDLDKFRSASLKHTKPGRVRALHLAQEDARKVGQEQKNRVVLVFSRASSIMDLGRKNSTEGGVGENPRMRRRRSIA